MKILLLHLLVLCCQHAVSQQLTGRVIDAATKHPLEQVNIGVVGKSLGTVSDRNGQFHLKLSNEQLQDSIRISDIRYQPLVFKSSDLLSILERNHGQLVIELSPRFTVLSEVVLAPQSFTRQVVGNAGRFKPLSTSFTSVSHASLANFKDRFGKDYEFHLEIATVMKLGRKGAILQEARFLINSNTYTDSIRFMVNIYPFKGLEAAAPINRDTIAITAAIKNGILTMPLEAYNIKVDDDFLLGLSWLEEPGEKSIHFGSAFFNADSYFRKGSHKKWDKLPAMGLGFSAVVLYRKR